MILYCYYYYGLVKSYMLNLLDDHWGLLMDLHDLNMLPVVLDDLLLVLVRNLLRFEKIQLTQESLKGSELMSIIKIR